MKTIAEIPRVMCIQNVDLSINPIDRLECSTAKKVMGLFQAPDGNTNAQFEALLEKVVTWT